MIYNEVQQDLFAVPSDYALAHCISSDFALGAGIAKEFVRRFDMRNNLMLRYADVMPVPFLACCLPIIVGSTVRSRVVFNLVTKPLYWKKPTYNALEAVLISMRTKAFCLGVKKIAMPKIGCGLDRLQWEYVSYIIKRVFANTDVEILVCYQ